MAHSQWKICGFIQIVNNLPSAYTGTPPTRMSSTGRRIWLCRIILFPLWIRMGAGMAGIIGIALHIL
jgi:hypothetical protein